ncbi:MAG TPA: hypothetical protein IGS52_11850 [Oscillatoriaceae cyanobacterium M33_DOE_052]|uniref:DUF5678 domain-containing protein n=1 Tax=Planktothricoides sp. SpSt-374 TaxID=2282167 RepID=A0A7C3ZTF3_9CYAN|nr:hypothetical protein [Oscillatoriaceae cyanobacterium M33_DOE_052]
MSYNTPEDFINAADQELMRQDWKAAWKVATEGLQHFPDHAELQKYAYILAPPKVTSVNRGGHPEIRANREWLQKHRAEYRGRWVGIKNGDLLAVGNSHDEIIAQVGSVKNTGILVTKVY